MPRFNVKLPFNGLVDIKVDAENEDVAFKEATEMIVTAIQSGRFLSLAPGRIEMHNDDGKQAEGQLTKLPYHATNTIDRFIEVNEEIFRLCDEKQAEDHIASLSNPESKALASALWYKEKIQRSVCGHPEDPDINTPIAGVAQR